MWNLREPQPSSPQGSARLRGRDDMLVDRVRQLYQVDSAIWDCNFSHEGMAGMVVVVSLH